MSYVNEFLGFRCAGDVLNSVAPLNNPAKEISESLALLRHVKGLALRYPRMLRLWDLCAGNALTGILAVHYLPFAYAIAVDRKPHRRPGHARVKRWEYRQGEIASLRGQISKNDVLIASHPCQAAEDICHLFNDSEARAMFILPCCQGKTSNKFTQLTRDRMSKYELWALHLARLVGGECSTRDLRILSPMNIIVSKVRELAWSS